MHGLSRLGNGVNSTPSSVSPPSSPRYRHSRNKTTADAGGGGGGGGGSGNLGHYIRGGSEMKLHSVVERLGFLVISAVYRRRGVLLLAPLLYISGMLLYMGTSGFDSVVNISSRHGSGYGDDITKPGSVYRSPQVFEKLWPFMEAENNGSSNLVYTYIYICFLLFLQINSLGGIVSCNELLLYVLELLGVCFSKSTFLII